METSVSQISNVKKEMTIKKTLERLMDVKGAGPFPSFSVVHLIKALELIAASLIGRGKLSEELGLGKGTTRTLIDRLKKGGLIAITKTGCSLTEKGEKLWSEFLVFYPQKARLERNELALVACNVAMLGKSCGNRVGTGVEQRDAAFMMGAKGATTLVFKERKLILPALSRNVAKDFPVAFNQINKLFDLQENDVVIVGSADTWEKADYGTLAAAWTLINGNCG